ncbi:hypothetical protein J437_LFUL000927 [Ladona fulva]|uniref:Uncharacterized protein n=1 Tax=Ladona fulva TaxID=123851 RepID=A0A8K0K835_LADFU|nr:hypothetical protein J437_LFUL000927 [Ladona fulva]
MSKKNGKGSPRNYSLRSHKPNRRYLHTDLILKKMFNLYELQCKENNIKAVNDFDSHFHQPCKDICQKCDFLNIKIKASDDDEEKNKLTEECSPLRASRFS